MSKDFEWKTEEEIRWDEPAGEPPADLRAFLKRRWRWLALSAILLLVGGSIVYSILNRRVKQAEDAAVADILATHTLLRQAALEKDFDLLKAITSDQDDWDELQVELLNIGLLLDRRPLNLNINLESSDQEPPQVTLSPDLQTADLVQQFPYEAYQTVDGETLTQTIWLEHIFRYRRQEESWVLAAIPDNQDFWGSWQTNDEGSQVTIIYPQRDEAFVPFLMEKFDALVAQICQDDTIDCPPNFKLEIRLERRPTALQTLNESVFNTFFTESQGSYHLSFPTPTLVGRPVDEAGNEALYHGYANRLAAVMALRYAAEGAFVVEQDIDDNLAAWGLERPPEPQQAIPISQPLPPPPIPFPEQDILLACAGFSGLALFRYNPRANRWSNELGGHQITYLSSQARGFAGSLMASLPDDSGILVNLTDFDGENVSSQLVSWRDGQEQLLLETDYGLNLLAEPIQRQFDPTGRKLLFFDLNFALSDEGLETARPIPYILDLEACLLGSCETKDYDGYPYFSPDLSWALIVDTETQSQLRLQNEQTSEEIALGRGYSPYWLDTNTFVYIRPEQEGDDTSYAEIVTATTDDALNGRILFDSADIAATLNLEGPTNPLIVRAVVAHPNQPDWLFITVILNPTEDTYEERILSYDEDTGQLSQLIDLENNSPGQPLQFIDDGQSLVVQTNTPDSPFGPILIIPLDPAQKTAEAPLETLLTDGVFNNDWSQDGRWLLLVRQNTLRLIAPGHNYDQILDHDNSACSVAVWVNP